MREFIDKGFALGTGLHVAAEAEYALPFLEATGLILNLGIAWLVESPAVKSTLAL